MNSVNFNFERIGNMADFYAVARKEFGLPEFFGDNLDALWDALTGDVKLPLKVKFTHMTMNQLEQFDQLISLFEDASEELGNDLVFEYFLKKAQ